MANEIVLPPGTEYVATADVPELLARALHPETPEQPRTVSYFIKTERPGATGEAANWDGRPIDDDDSKVLARLWADMPTLPEHATADEVRPYIEKANMADLGWTLDVCWNNPTLNSSIIRLEVEREHQQAIVDAIRRGNLKVVAPHTRLATDEFRANSEVSVEELRRYVAQFKIVVRLESPAEAMPVTGAALIAEQATLWERRKPAHLFGEGFSQEMRNLTTLSQYLEFDTWTPEAAAMLVCGLQAPIIDGQLCTEIPEKGAMGLDSCFISGSQDPFHVAKRVLGIWRSQENPPARVRPLDFIRWCQARGFDTAWLRSIEADAKVAGVDRSRSTYGQPKFREHGATPDAQELSGADADVSREKVTGTVRHSIKLRRNILDKVIDRAIADAGSDRTADVYVALRELALDGHAPFTGQFEGDALCYTNDKNEPAKLTKGALDAKLRRRRKRC